jgi:1-deoxy-D-xylulose-5-phosphate reductoisomerase
MADTVKKLVILGSTGSIGRQALDIVRNFPEKYRIIGLAAGINTALFSKQVGEFKPRYIFQLNTQSGRINSPAEVLPLNDLAGLPEADIIVIALSGSAGIIPTYTAVNQGKKIALANKESLVAAGALITAAADKNKAMILPVDSEHSAIWQCLAGEKSPPQRLILTASGGPFRHFSKVQLEKVTPEQALQHPSWNMGKKVTIDSATLMNKGLEIIEAHWLFHLPVDQISVIVHPQSIVHSMVEFNDGTIKAQLACPDMRLPIQYALTYPERLTNNNLPRLDLNTLHSLTFETPAFQTFPCLNLAIKAIQIGGTYPAALSIVDEYAVNLFLKGLMKFTEIPVLVERILDKHVSISKPTIEDIMAVSDQVQQQCREIYKGDNW